MTTVDLFLCGLKLLLVICVLLKGTNGQGRGWLNAHATFYGANQNPSTLGKISFD